MKNLGTARIIPKGANENLWKNLLTISMELWINKSVPVPYSKSQKTAFSQCSLEHPGTLAENKVL